MAKKSLFLICTLLGASAIHSNAASWEGAGMAHVDGGTEGKEKTLKHGTHELVVNDVGAVVAPYVGGSLGPA